MIDILARRVDSLPVLLNIRRFGVYASVILIILKLFLGQIMRTITVRIPRLPAVAAAAASDGSGTGTFGPLQWEWSTGLGLASNTSSLTTMMEQIYSHALASCPGAVSYRLEYEEFGPPFPLPPLNFDAVTGGVIIYLDQYLRALVYAISATGAELGPIDVYISGT